jgi:hypothetical protein
MSADERDDGMSEVLARSVDLLRDEVPVRAGWRADLLARIDDERQGAPSGWRLRPSLAIAAGVALLLIGVAIGRSMRQPAPLVTSQVAATAANVRFVYVAPGAASVSLVGDFNQWNPTAKPLRRLGDGTWITDVPLAPGRYAYAFVVDGKVVTDPSAPRATGDFGENSIVMVRGS